MDLSKDPAMLQALQASIAHWERIATKTRLPSSRYSAADENPDLEFIFSKDCPLCEESELRLDAEIRESGIGRAYGKCEFCPVMARTGRDQCETTPWEQVHVEVELFLFRTPAAGSFRSASRRITNDPNFGPVDFIEAAKQEVAFLRGLLPKPTTEQPTTEQNGNQTASCSESPFSQG
jgi:hypothetical protein